MHARSYLQSDTAGKKETSPRQVYAADLLGGKMLCGVLMCHSGILLQLAQVLLYKKTSAAVTL